MPSCLRERVGRDKVARVRHNVAFRIEYRFAYAPTEQIEPIKFALGRRFFFCRCTLRKLARA